MWEKDKSKKIPQDLQIALEKALAGRVRQARTTLGAHNTGGRAAYGTPAIEYSGLRDTN